MEKGEPEMTVEVLGNMESNRQEVLTPSTLEFLASLHRRIEPSRQRLLAKRTERQSDPEIIKDFLSETAKIREASWTISPTPDDLLDRRVEITGPTDAKMVINALNSGARVYMADFEDALSPTWANILDGQVNLSQAIEGTLRFVGENGKEYRINKDRQTVLVVRPRGWHLQEMHVRVDGQPLSGSLFDFGVYVFRNYQRLKERGTGPYFYLPKLETWEEAKLWNEVFEVTEDILGMQSGTIKATVLIETITAALQMEEILYALRHHIVGLNAGRWDYLFSIIKTFRQSPMAVLPDRNQITMAVPFMRAYAELLVDVCHKRGAHAIGGMAAFIPSRKNPEVNRLAFQRVIEDKEREASQGFDGTWVAHPDLVPIATQVFDQRLGSQPHQKHWRREIDPISAQDLLNFHVPGGTVTEEGVRNNVSVALQYLTAWLKGQGAVGLFNLMEDAATAEIARSQLYQWNRHSTRVHEGAMINRELLEDVIRQTVEQLPASRELSIARNLVWEAIFHEPFMEFITVPAYEKWLSSEYLMEVEKL